MARLADLLELPDAELRALLLVGEAPERLRAAWALALRSESGAARAIRETFAGDISEGLRQQLIVVLAGLGERNAILEIAKADPIASVRAVATAYTIRTAAEGDLQARIFARSKLREESPEVRLAVLLELQAGRMLLDAADVTPTLHDADSSLRRVALLSLLELSGKDAAARDALVNALSADEQLLELISELGRHEAFALLRALSDAPAPVLASALGAVRLGHVTLTWDDTAFVFSRPEPAIANEILLAIPSCPPAAALPWLARFYLGGDDEFAAARSTAWFFLKSLITEETAALIPPEHRHALSEDLEQRWQTDESALAIPEEEDGPDAYEREFYESELAAIGRLRATLKPAR